MQDTRVIHRHGNFMVLAQRQEVMFHDGSTVHLHPVSTCSADWPAAITDTFLRALHHEGLRWLIFDLRHTNPGIDTDMLRLQPRDTPGVVFYTLRGAYAGAAPFCTAVLRCFTAAWWQHDDAIVKVAA